MDFLHNLDGKKNNEYYCWCCHTLGDVRMDSGSSIEWYRRGLEFAICWGEENLQLLWVWSGSESSDKNRQNKTKISDNIELEDGRELNVILKGRLPLCHRCATWRHRRKDWPSGAIKRNNSEEPQVVQREETVRETAADNDAVENEEIQTKATSKDSKTSEEAI